MTRPVDSQQQQHQSPFAAPVSSTDSVMTHPMTPPRNTFSVESTPAKGLSRLARSNLQTPPDTPETKNPRELPSLASHSATNVDLKSSLHLGPAHVSLLEPPLSSDSSSFGHSSNDHTLASTTSSITTCFSSPIRSSQTKTGDRVGLSPIQSSLKRLYRPTTDLIPLALSSRTILCNLLDMIDFASWQGLYHLTPNNRRVIEGKRSLTEAVLLRFLRDVGYKSWNTSQWEQELLPLSLDVSSFVALCRVAS